MPPPFTAILEFVEGCHSTRRRQSSLCILLHGPLKPDTIFSSIRQMTACFAGQRHVDEGRFPVRSGRQGRRGPRVRQPFPDRAAVSTDTAADRDGILSRGT